MLPERQAFRAPAKQHFFSRSSPSAPTAFAAPFCAWYLHKMVANEPMTNGQGSRPISWAVPTFSAQTQQVEGAIEAAPSGQSRRQAVRLLFRPLQVVLLLLLLLLFRLARLAKRACWLTSQLTRAQASRTSADKFALALKWRSCRAQTAHALD